MRLVRLVANVLWARPLRRERWHPLSKQEQEDAEVFRQMTKSAPPGGRRVKPLSLRWWLGQAPDGSKRIGLDLRLLTKAGLIELREKAIRSGYDGRAWRDGHEYEINETAFIWLNGGLRLPNGVIICDLVVSQRDVADGEVSRVISLRRHRLDVFRSDWKRLRRATRSDERDIYHTLQASLPFDSNEVESW